METTKYTLLECNRLRAGINEDNDEYKNRGTNMVNSSGIVVKKVWKKWSAIFYRKNVAPFL